jgi:glucose-6-phosphate isomerase
MQRSSLWDALKEHYEKDVKGTHLRTLLQDEKRNAALRIELPNLIFDFSHEKILPSTIDHFSNLVKESGLRDRIKAMYSGV